MTDRVPGAPGQYSAVIRSEELEKLQNGENFIITLTRDDQPITPGTPYSKAAVLPDELAAILCPGVEDPAPKDALQALADRQIESVEHPGCFYRNTDGEKEWLNPPMLPGVEYRTAERFGGNVVYCKHISHTSTENYGGYGEGPVEVSIPHGISGYDSIVRVDARHQGGHLLPIITSGGGTAAVVGVTTSNIELRFSNCSFGARTWKFNLYYTKKGA